MIGIGVIGCGYWGPNLVRNFSVISSAKLIMACDLKNERLNPLASLYPSIKTTTNYQEMLNDPSIDAVAIATPVSTHFKIAMESIKAGKHVFIEKPMTLNSDQGERLIEAANNANLVLMVDHTFIYTGAICKIKELVDRKELGEIYYYDSIRVNLGLFQHDVNVMWDLAVHDISIMNYVLGSKPTAVSATGMGHVDGSQENTAYMTLFFDSNLIAHINVNWLSPVKLRQTLMAGSKKMVVFNDIEPSEKVKIYDSGVTLNNNPDSTYQMLIGYRVGDMWAPQYNRAEALRTEAFHFINCIEGKERPLSDGEMGLRVVKILEGATISMKERGRLVTLSL